MRLLPHRSSLTGTLRPLAPLVCCTLFFPSSASQYLVASAAGRVPFAAKSSLSLPSRWSPSIRLAAFAPVGRRRQISEESGPPARLHAAAAMILDSPSADRNKRPIWDVLSAHVLPDLLRSDDDVRDGDGPLRVLEVAAGCGVHTLHFASSYFDGFGGGEGSRRGLEWYPTDPDPSSRRSIDARAASLPSDGPARAAVRPAAPLTLGDPGAAGVRDGVVTRRLDGSSGEEERDVSALEGVLGSGRMDLVVCINMIHIAPWSAALGLMSCASAALRPGGMLYCYGPYKVGGTAVDSNLNFDRSLRMRDPGWGVRDLEDVVEVASRNDMELVRTVEMPANNLSVIFRKR